MAWARIGVYRLGGDQGGIGRDEAVRLTRESAAPLVRGLRGFIDYELVEAGDTFLAPSAIGGPGRRRRQSPSPTRSGSRRMPPLCRGPSRSTSAR